jgi:MFS family permease
MPRLTGSTRIVALDAANFFVRYHYYLVAFIFSTFLATYVGITYAGVISALSACIGLFVLPLMPDIFRRLGTARSITIIGVTEIIVLILLAVANAPAVIAILSLVMSGLVYCMFLGLDILVESATCDENETGSVRSIFLTVTNISALIATLSIGAILSDDQYAYVFLIAAVVLLPFIFIGATSLPQTSSVAPLGRLHIFDSFRSLLHVPRILRPVLAVHFLLQLYFAWTIFYVPLYLRIYVGLPWHTVSVIMAVSLIPYLIAEIPLGWIADKFWGEKEILIAGCVVLAFGTILLAWPANNDLTVWTILFLIGNTGAAAVEIMTESNFFKRVDGNDGGLISVLRMLRPLAGVVGPFSAAACVLFLSGSSVFLVFAAVLMFGVPIALRVHDTK